jgi:hydroxypyruvate reductase
MPDRPQGYVRRKEGLLPADPQAAERYALQAKHAEVQFDEPQRWRLVETADEVCAEHDWELYEATADPSHTHLLVGWRSEELWKSVSIRLKQRLGSALSKLMNRPGPWFSRGSSRKRVCNREHFRYLMEKYPPKHGPIRWTLRKHRGYSSAASSLTRKTIAADVYPRSRRCVEMSKPSHALRDDAQRIWHAGLEAVRSERLVREVLRVDGPHLSIGEEQLALNRIGRIVVVGAGKASAGMAVAVEEALGPRLLAEKRVTGWINVPADCVRPTQCIKLHGARPPGVNEPTQAAAEGAKEILRLVGSLGQADLCLCLISGGGSALLPAPVEGISLADKLAVTRWLSAAGANIEQLNTVRKQLSLIKGGGLARACRAGQLAALLISDVLGDPLDIIASGPTVPDSSSPEAALAVLEKFDARAAGIPAAIFDYLSCKRQQAGPDKPLCRVTNLVIGNNATAVDAAGCEALRLGYSHAMISASQSEGPAEPLGRHLAGMALKMRGEPGPDCLISGGEPVVTLVEASQRGLGGRSQQLVLAALESLYADGAAGIAMLSGGTDGEDGPTDAAGAFFDAAIVAEAKRQGMDPAASLARNDAYHFFEPLGALLKTGPTHTNVCDVRVIVVERGR